MNITLIIAIILAIVIVVSFQMMKKHEYQKLLNMLQYKDLGPLESECETAKVKILFDKYSIDYLKLNAYVIHGDEKKIDQQFTRMFKLKLTEKRNEDLTMKAFNYYVGIENKQKAKECLDRINALKNKQMQAESERVYNIFMDKGYKYLEEMESGLKDFPESKRGVNEYLVSVMYENKGDKQKASEYKKLSEKHMKMLDRKIEEDMRSKEKKK